METTSNIFELEINYEKSKIEMINLGQYDWTADEKILKRFPIKGKGIAKFEARFFTFNRMVDSLQVIQEIEQTDFENPWRLGSIEHLLTFGATFPDEQRKYPIICLGSVTRVRGYDLVPGLWGGIVMRYLYLLWFKGGWWDERCHFLAVRPI